jgi:DNA-binding MarR family transcriptional regulator
MYDKVNGRAPAEADLQRYFGTTPPSVHDMVIRLERAGWIERKPGQARSIRVLVPIEELPALE